MAVCIVRNAIWILGILNVQNVVGRWTNPGRIALIAEQKNQGKLEKKLILKGVETGQTEN